MGATNMGDLNMGAMLAMSSGTTDTASGCTDASSDTNEQILEMFMKSNYTNNQFNISDGIDQLQITGILVMSQFNQCGYNNYLVALDGALSQKPQLIGAVNNFA